MRSSGAAVGFGGTRSDGFATWVRLARPHILTIVFASTLTYGWIFTELHNFVIPLIAVWDWFIVNFANKAVDVDEDLANGIQGAELAAKHKAGLERICFSMIAFGLIVGWLLAPSLLPFRILFTLVGLAYNYKIVPWPGGMTRLKEMYFFKNFGSSILFTLSVFIYPLVGMGAHAHYPLGRLLIAILFFIPLELTYEIIYDLRDVEGDRKLHVPTYPVVHGPHRAKQIIYGLLALSFAAIMFGALSGMLRLREWVVVFGVVQQLLVVRWFLRGDRMPTERDAVAITYLGAAQLLSYNLWVVLGLPLGA